MKRGYVDPEGPDGWIKDPCPYCQHTEGGKPCTLYGNPNGTPLKEPHRARERAWQERRVRELAVQP